MKQRPKEKGLFDHWEEWRDLARHDSLVTVGDVRREQIARGRLRELDKEVPEFTTFWGALQALRVRYKQRHERERLEAIIRYVKKNIESYAELYESKAKPDPAKAAYVTWYAYLYDMFASAYGWTLEEFEALPWASISEFRLAIEMREARQSTRRAMESNLTKESEKAITRHVRRKVKLPKGMFEANLKKQFDAFFGARN